MSDKKKFKDTGFGKLLLQKIPSAAGLVGELLPDQGVLGVVKNIIGRADLTDAEKDELFQAQADFELEVLRIEAQDRDSARKRQVGMAQAGKKDWLMGVTGVIGLLAFIYIVWAATNMEIKNENLFYFIAGNVMGVAIGIFTYFFGSSKGSKDKTEALKNFGQ